MDTKKYSINPKGGGKEQDTRDKRKTARRKPAPDDVSKGVKRADQRSRENAEAVPLHTESKTQLEAISKRDPPNTKTWRNRLRGQKMGSAGLGYKSTGGAVGSVIREKVQSARKCKILSVYILNGRASKIKELDTVTITAVDILLQRQVTQLSLTDSPQGPCPGLQVSRTPRPPGRALPHLPGDRASLPFIPRVDLTGPCRP